MKFISRNKKHLFSEVKGKWSRKKIKKTKILPNHLSYWNLIFELQSKNNRKEILQKSKEILKKQKSKLPLDAIALAMGYEKRYYPFEGFFKKI